jgi:hypothetical protein
MNKITATTNVQECNASKDVCPWRTKQTCSPKQSKNINPASNKPKRRDSIPKLPMMASLILPSPVHSSPVPSSGQISPNTTALPQLQTFSPISSPLSPTNVSSSSPAPSFPLNLRPTLNSPVDKPATKLPPSRPSLPSLEKSKLCPSKSQAM